jgi:hypothetical protein
MASMTFNVVFQGYWLESGIDSIPAKSGVYCVYECKYNSDRDTISIRRLIYIGEAEDVRDRIKKHEKKPEWKGYVSSGNELCYNFGYVESAYRDRVKAAFIFKHGPPENTEYVDEFPFDTTIIKAGGKKEKLSRNFTVYRSA